jgi:regulator of protease activity HflC (stomatin/prohibitin superfamily)
MNPITSLVTIVLALIGALLFLARFELPGIGFGIVAVLVLFSLKMANNWQRFVILRAGKLSSVKGPGLFMIIPVIDAVASPATRCRSMSMPSSSGTCTTRRPPRSTSPTTVRPSTGWRKRRCAK